MAKTFKALKRIHYRPKGAKKGAPEQVAHPGDLITDLPSRDETPLLDQAAIEPQGEED